VPTVAETAYPRLKNQIREKELTEIYTPTFEELNLASQHTRKGATKLGFLVLLKTFQRLGYFVAPTTIPNAIVKHIANCSALACPPDILKSYDTSGTRWRHIIIIRDYLSLFQILKQVKLRSTTQDKSIEASIQFLIDHQGSRKDWLNVVETEDDQIVKLLDLEWIPQKWWQLITNQKTKKSYPDCINRRYFEMCVFSQVMWELKSGDLYVEDSDAFADYRTQQISWSELAKIESLIEDRIKPVNLLDILTDTELWLNWTQYFRLLSGHDSKIQDSVSRYLAATFCYGCNLGSSQTANSLSNFDRKQMSLCQSTSHRVAILGESNLQDY
jgi:hypothetical protein